MANKSLKSYIIQRKLDLYEEAMDIKERMDLGVATDTDTTRMAFISAQLREVEAIEKLCRERGRY